MKSPDEIKTGLECSLTEVCTGSTCPYWVEHDLCIRRSRADALALIQQLEAQVPNWISVKERLPEEESIVLVHFCTRVCAAIYLWQETFETLEGHSLVGVTHWMPLPEPPEE